MTTGAATRSRSIDVLTPDGVADSYLTYPDDGVPHPGVLVLQDGFGVRPTLRALADRIAAQGYTVLLPNAYYRHGRAPVVELPDFIDPAGRPEVFERVIPMIRELTPDLLRADVGAYLECLATVPEVSEGKVGLTGYCMGARLAVLAAGMFPDRIGAVGGFHGGPLVTDSPDSPHLAAENITAEIYFAHAGNDAHMTPEHIAQFDKALDDASVRHRTETYEGVEHGFTQSDTAAYDAAADARHYRELLALFDRTLH